MRKRGQVMEGRRRVATTGRTGSYDRGMDANGGKIRLWPGEEKVGEGLWKKQEQEEGAPAKNSYLIWRGLYLWIRRLISP